MMQYISNINIKINADPNTFEKITQTLQAYAATPLDNGTTTVTIKTIGSPEPVFQDIARAIWWVAGFCTIEFFVIDSALCYSSPTIFNEDQFNLITTK